MSLRIPLAFACLAFRLCAVEIPEGRMELHLTDALFQNEPDKPRRLRLELIREDGEWLAPHGDAWTFNKSDHAGELAGIAWDGKRLVADLRMEIKGDNWVPGGPAEYRIELERRADGRYAGRHRGRFRDRDVEGEALGDWFAPRARLENHPPFDPAERPRILFRGFQREALRAKARTPWGQDMLGRLRASKDAVAFGLLYQLEGRAEDAAEAQVLAAELYDKRELGGVNNYPNPMGERLGRLAIAYDLCAEGWDAEFREKIHGHLRHFSDRALNRPHTFSQRMNYSPATDTHGAMRGGGALAALAVADDSNRALRRVALRHVQDYFQFAIGEGGWQAGGEKALAEGMGMPLAFALAWRNLHGREPSWRPDVSLLAPRHLMQAVPLAEDAFFQQSDNLTDGLFDAGQLAHSYALSDARYRPALKTFWDRRLAAGSPTDGLDLALTFVHYPLDAQGADPAAVLPKVWEAPARGGYVFRNTWRDDQDIVLQFFGKTLPVAGWELPRAGDIVLYGLGHVWGTRGAAKGRDWTRRHHNVVLLPRDDHFAMGTGRIVHRALETERAALTLDLDQVYRGRQTDGKRTIDPWTHDFQLDATKLDDIGIRGHRALAVDLSGMGGAPLVFALADRIEGGRAKIWQWQLPANDGPEVVVEDQRFHLRRPDGSSLTATFLRPAGVRLQAVASTHEAPVPDGRTDGKASQRPAIHAWSREDAAGGDFLVVFTLQRGDAPVPRSLDAATHQVGGLLLREVGSHLSFGTAP